MIFTDLYRLGQRMIFDDDLLYKKIPNNIAAYFNVVEGFELDGRSIIVEFDYRNFDIKFAIIRANNINDGKLDIMFGDDNVPTVLTIIPNDFLERGAEYVANDLIDIFSYWVNALAPLFIVGSDSYLKDIYDISSGVLAFKLLAEAQPSELNTDYFIDKSKDKDDLNNVLTRNVLIESLKYSIDELLNRAGIIAVSKEQYNEISNAKKEDKE